MSHSPTVLAKVTRSPTLTKESCIAQTAADAQRLAAARYFWAARSRGNPIYPGSLPSREAAQARASPPIDAPNTVAGKRRNLGGAEPKLGEDFLGLRPKPLRRQANGRRVAVIPHRMIDEGDRRTAFACPFDGDQSLHVFDLRILDEVGIALHPRVPDLRPLHACAPVLVGFQLQPRGDDLADLVLAAPGVLVGE